MLQQEGLELTIPIWSDLFATLDKIKLFFLFCFPVMVSLALLSVKDHFSLE